MKVTESPPEIRDDLGDDDPLESFLEEVEEEKYTVQAGINGQNF